MREREQREKAGERAERERAERERREREQREQILSSSSFGSTFKRFAPAPLESHQPPPSTPPGSASNTMADEREIVSVDSTEEEDSDDAWGRWTAKGRRVLPTQELLAATASSRRVASKRAASAKPSDDFVPGSTSDPPAARHRKTAMHGSWQSLDARLCQLQAKVDKINHAKGKPGSASCELFVGKSQSKELWVDISWARNQGLDRVDGPINPQKAAWSDRFEFQIVESGQRKWLKVTRVDTNKGWGQVLRVSMTSSMVESEPSNASRTPKPSSNPPPLKQFAPIAAPSGFNRPGMFASSPTNSQEPAHCGPAMWKRLLGGPGGSRPIRSPSPLKPKPTSVPTPGSASGSKRQLWQTPTEDYVRKERAKKQRSAAVAAGIRDSHRLWLDKKYKIRTQKRLAKQSAKEGFA